MRAQPQVTVVGDTTWGSSGQPLQLDFGGGMRARVSTRREYYPDGSEFEGVGIVPDVVVPRSAEALRTGKDPALAAAIAILREPAIVQAARGAAHRGAGRGAGGRGPANRGARR